MAQPDLGADPKPSARAVCRRLCMVGRSVRHFRTESDRVPLALLGAQAIRSLLFGLEATDLTSIVGATLTMMLVGLLAGLVPGWRAAQVEPAIALRAE